MSKTPKDAEARLTDLDVREVSVVDRPANKRRFLIVKRDGGGLAVIRTEESMSRAIPREAAEDFGHIVLTDDDDDRAAIMKDEDFADLVGLDYDDEEDEDSVSDDADLEEIEKGDVGHAVRVTKAAIAKLTAIANQLKAKGKQKDSDPSVLKAIGAVGKALRALVEKLGAKGGDGDKGKEKAKPKKPPKAEDAADDDEAKSKAAGGALEAVTAAVGTLMKAQQSLRKLGEGDAVPTDVIEMIAGAADALLSAAEVEVEEEGDKKPPKPKKKPGSDEEQMDEDKEKARKSEGGFEVFFKRGTEDDADPTLILKVGQKMKRTRLSLFKKAVEMLAAILTELEGQPKDARQTKKEKADESFQQQMLSGLAGIKKDIGAVSKRVEDLEQGGRPTGADDDPPKPVEKKAKGMWSSILGT